MDWLWAIATFVVGAIVGAVLTVNRQSEGSTLETFGFKPKEKDQIMATLEELQAASAELGTKIDALIAAVQDVRVAIEQALAADDANDSAALSGLLADLQAKTAAIEAALTPANPVEPEVLPEAPPEATQLPTLPEEPLA